MLLHKYVLLTVILIAIIDIALSDVLNERALVLAHCSLPLYFQLICIGLRQIC